MKLSNSYDTNVPVFQVSWDSPCSYMSLKKEFKKGRNLLLATLFPSTCKDSLSQPDLETQGKTVDKSLPLRNKRWSKSIFLKGLPIDVFEIGKKKKDKLLLLQYASGQWTWIGLLLSLQYSGPTFHHTKGMISPLLSMSMDILHVT